jgi:2,3-bisphosphoglycerate-independent phosphoglycerate mutase
MHNNPVVLVILDGFGHSEQTTYNAVYHASMPNFKQWFSAYPHAFLHASGHYAGLPDGYIGNSEVGHLTIGAGRIIEQPLTRINTAIQDGTFFALPLLQERLHALAKSGKALHIMGLLSDAGIHSHQEQMYAYIKAAADASIKRIFLHPFLDGRDTKPCSAETYLEPLQKVATSHGAIIASLHGRFYAMDRNAHWDRTMQSCTVLTQPSTQEAQSWPAVLEASYAQGDTDEFLKPTLLVPDGIVRPGDGIIFINIRADRARQLTSCFVAPKTVPARYTPVQLAFFITPVAYGKQLTTDVLFPSPVVHHTLKEVLSAAGRTLFSIAESEKYAHVTYFFNGEKEDSVSHEVRHLIPSKVMHDYSKLPEMSAYDITRAVILSLQSEPKDFYVVNYANPDMVGHSGNFDATVKALGIVDEQLGLLYNVVVAQMRGTLLITSDHGKAECMADPQSGMPLTAHTTNDVPLVMVAPALAEQNSEQSLLLPLTQLADIAPFILTHMGIPVPAEMRGEKG